jgi:phage terminase large subunit-like protein
LTELSPAVKKLLEGRSPEAVQAMAKIASARLREKAGHWGTFREFVEHVKPDFVWYKHCIVLAEVLDRVVSGELKRVLVFEAPRHGKQIYDRTPVFTPSGWKTHGDLKVGDYVYHPSGKPIKVLFISEKTPSNMCVEFTNGEKIYCHENHEWTVWDRSRNGWITRETKYFADPTNRGKKRHLWIGDKKKRSIFSVPQIGVLQFTESVLPVDPYVFGAWLGDGSTGKPCLTHSASDIGVADEIGKHYPKSCTWVHKTTGVLTTSFAGDGGVNRACSLAKDIAKTGAYKDKHIPDIYKFSSEEQRIKLLAGLIDTDGSRDKSSRIIFVNANKRLAHDVYDIALSLGWHPYITEKEPVLSSSGIQGKKKIYRVGFNPRKEIPVILERKKIKRFPLERRIGIKSIEYVDPIGEGHCIQVDSPDGLYLVGKTLIPTHNSELISRLLPAYYLSVHPQKSVALISYGSDLAYNLSKDARANYLTDGHKLRADSQAVAEWRTEENGMMWSDGISGSLTGKGFSLGLIDDSCKNREEAYSETIRNSTWNWYKSTFYTRQEPNASIVLIQTRWHQDDLAGRILEQENEEPEHWHIVNFSVDEKTVPERFPKTCTVEPDWRETDGIALCPERYPIEVLNHFRETIGDSVYNALYRQRPAGDDGIVWKKVWFEGKTFVGLPPCETFSDGIDWDTAYTEKEENAATAFVRSCVGVDGNIYITDLGFQWLEFPDMIKWMKSFESPHYIESKASGASAVQSLSKEGISANEVKVQGGDKIARAKLASPAVEAGKVYVRKDILDKLLEDEKQGILKFPSGKYADLNDAFTQALNRHRSFKPLKPVEKKKFKTYNEYMDEKVFNPIMKMFDRPKKPNWKGR